MNVKALSDPKSMKRTIARKKVHKKFSGIHHHRISLKMKRIWSIPGTTIGFQAWRLVADPKKRFVIGETRVSSFAHFSSRTRSFLWIYRKKAFGEGISVIIMKFSFPCFWHMTYSKLKTIILSSSWNGWFHVWNHLLDPEMLFWWSPIEQVFESSKTKVKRFLIFLLCHKHPEAFKI